MWTNSANSSHPSRSDALLRVHVPVLVEEVTSLLCTGSGGTFVDGTLGLGGHTEAIMERCVPDHMFCFEWDRATLELARERLHPWKDKIEFFHGSFTTIPEALESRNIKGIRGILLDIGLSSFLIEESGRGFSFQRKEPLDMRMDTSRSTTARDLVNELPQEQLKEILINYGEERWAHRIAQFIVERRRQAPIETSAELADLVASAIPRRFHPRRLHPATRTFQALRIAVNQELENLKSALDSLPSCLEPGGRLAIISFHSLEDRLVKRAFMDDPRLKRITKRPVTASQEEIEANPRARSAKLRVAERIWAPSPE